MLDSQVSGVPSARVLGEIDSAAFVAASGKEVLSGGVAGAAQSLGE
jgi:hypothetical protein